MVSTVGYAPPIGSVTPGGPDRACVGVGETIGVSESTFRCAPDFPRIDNVGCDAVADLSAGAVSVAVDGCAAGLLCDSSTRALGAWDGLVPALERLSMSAGAWRNIRCRRSVWSNAKASTS